MKKSGKQGFKSNAMEKSLWVVIRIKVAADFTYFSYSPTNPLTGDDFSRTTEELFESHLRQMTEIIIHYILPPRTFLKSAQQHFQDLLAQMHSVNNYHLQHPKLKFLYAHNIYF